MSERVKQREREGEGVREERGGEQGKFKSKVVSKLF